MDQPFFSIIIPAHNEEGSIGETVETIVAYFAGKGVTDYEILVVNDHSRDGTEQVLQHLAARFPAMRYVSNDLPGGFGYALRTGLANFSGEAACIVMGDLSDDPQDIYKYYTLMKKGAECVFGSRFIRGSKVYDYPKLKYVVNRLANLFIKVLFNIPHNDITNAFKCYRREVVQGLSPFMSAHFNLTVELPLKAIVRGYKFETVPISWRNRKQGKSKLHMHEMGSRYLFIVLYVLLEKWLSKGDYYRSRPQAGRSV